MRKLSDIRVKKQTPWYFSLVSSRIKTHLQFSLHGDCSCEPTSFFFLSDDMPRGPGSVTIATAIFLAGKS